MPIRFNLPNILCFCCEEGYRVKDIYKKDEDVTLTLSGKCSCSLSYCNSCENCIKCCPCEGWE